MKNVDFSVQPKKTVAIVGPTGAGKTTLVNLLMRFYEINQGAITFDGIDITKLSRQNLRNLFGMVLQNTWLFEGTVADNIAYGKKDASREEIIEAAKIAQCDHFIRTLPQGYDTIISSENGALSQGQQQLLTIARIILANPPVVILDEAQNTTSAQIKMFLTRMGWNTKMIVTGDRTQIDLPPSQKSGLIEAVRILSGVSGIAFIEMNKRDIVRHKLVTRIVEAYDRDSAMRKEARLSEQKSGETAKPEGSVAEETSRED